MLNRRSQLRAPTESDAARLLDADLEPNGDKQAVFPYDEIMLQGALIERWVERWQAGTSKCPS